MLGKNAGFLLLLGRSPHGERGLKYRQTSAIDKGVMVALLMESVD